MAHLVAFKRDLLDDPHWSWEKRNSTEQDSLNREIIPVRNVPLGQESLDAQGVVSRCIVVANYLYPRFVLPQRLSYFAHWADYRLQDLPVDLLIDRLALWQNLPVDDSPYIEKGDQRNLHFV